MNNAYLKTYFTVLASGVVLIAVFNWFVDPYTLYNSPRIPGFNEIKADFVSYLRLTKAHTIRRHKPDALILGTSKAARGLSPDHAGWEGLRCYNASLPASSMYEALRYFQHAHAIQPQKRVVLALEPRSFDAGKPNKAFSETRMSVAHSGDRTSGYASTYALDLLSTLLSHDALMTSLRTIRYQNMLTKSLMDNGRYDRTSDDFDYHRAFNVYTRSNYRRLRGYGPGPSFSDDNNLGLGHYRTLLRTAYDHGIELFLLVPPAHAWYWETVRMSGNWADFETWKRKLVSINEVEAARSRKTAFPFWDFSGYHDLVTEPIPEADEAAVKMHWFWDPVHFKVALGDLVFDRILADNSTARGTPGEFGIRIDSGNIDAHLNSIRLDQTRYQANHPEDIDTIRKIIDSSG